MTIHIPEIVVDIVKYGLMGFGALMLVCVGLLTIFHPGGD